MGHKRLWEAVNRVEASGLHMRREHNSKGITHIKIVWWSDDCLDALFEGFFATGASDKQADAMNRVCDQFNNFK